MNKLKLCFTIAAFGMINLQAQSDQNYTTIGFERIWDLEYVYIDTVLNPENIWQIGEPKKIIFDSANYSSSAIVTDTALPYPINDTSSFIVYHLAHEGKAVAGIQFNYKIDTDSLLDYGIVEFSPDSGKTWYNLATDSGFVDHTNNILTGLTSEWTSYDVNVSYNFFNVNPGDTIQYKFTFISDSINTNKEGWMIDNISAYDITPGFEEHHNDFSSYTFPNPTATTINIKFENSSRKPHQLTIFNESGKQVYREDNIRNDNFSMDIEQLKKGLYFYLLTNESNSRSSGKFIIANF